MNNNNAWKPYFGMIHWLSKMQFMLTGGELFLTKVRSRAIHLFTNRFESMLYEIGFVIVVLLMCWGYEGSLFLILPLLLIVNFAVVYDFDVIYAFWEKFKNSKYHQATGVSRKKLYFDGGLQGEFKAYVLSRQLEIPHKVLFNVCIPMKNGNFQEADAIIITKNLLYVIECKNRGGVFKGEFDEKDWVQYIGSQEHSTENIYMQNQKHTMAIDQLLLESGIIQNGQIACINVILRCGDFKISAEKSKLPYDLIYGDNKYVLDGIRKWENMLGDSGDDGIMEEVYEFLLPYSLYTQGEREQMMAERKVRSVNKEFKLGPFRTAWIKGGIPGITDDGEDVLIRTNDIYTQVKIGDATEGECWQTRTDIPERYRRMCE